MLTIRRATVDDALLMTQLLNAVQQVHVEGRPDIFRPLEIDDALIAMYQDRLHDPDVYVFIAEINGEPVGHTVADIRRRPVNPYTYEMDYLSVDEISVNSEYRGQGISEALMNRVEAVARELNIERITLAVWAFNQRAIQFYERLGYSAYQIQMEKVITD